MVVPKPLKVVPKPVAAGAVVPKLDPKPVFVLPNDPKPVAPPKPPEPNVLAPPKAGAPVFPVVVVPPKAFGCPKVDVGLVVPNPPKLPAPRLVVAENAGFVPPPKVDGEPNEG